MQTGVLTFDGDMIEKRTAFDALQQHIPLVVIVNTQTVDVFFKVSFVDKGSQCILFKIGYRAGIKLHLGIIGLHQMFRQYHIADTDGGGQCFCKSIDINHFLKNIDALKGWDWLASQTKLAVIIIFDNIAGRRF